MGEDAYDPSLWDRYRNLLTEAYVGVRTLRLALANHPAASSVEVPGWLFKGDIRNYAPPARAEASDSTKDEAEDRD